MLENQVSPVAIYGESVAGRSFSVRKQLNQLSISLKTSTFDLAELLFEAQESNYFSDWGFKNVGEFAEKELSIRERKSQYLIRITKVCKEVGLTRTQYEPAGISKLREICTLDPQGTWFNPETKTNEPLNERIVNLISNAPELTREEVIAEVLSLKGMTKGNRPVVRSFSFVHDAWENVIKKALERMRMHLGSAGRDDQGMAKEYSDGAVLEMIMADWLSGDAEEPADVPTEELKKLMSGLNNIEAHLEEPVDISTNMITEEGVDNGI